VLQTALDRDRVEALAHGVSPPDYLDAVETGEVLFEDGRDRKDALTRRAEFPEQLGILELADDIRFDIDAVQPLIDRAANGGIRGLNQQRCPVQGFWKATAPAQSARRTARRRDTARIAAQAVVPESSA
jgi:hypothetical protein